MLKVIIDNIDVEKSCRYRHLVLEDEVCFALSVTYTDNYLSRILLCHYIHPGLCSDEEIGANQRRLAEVHWAITPNLLCSTWVCGFAVPNDDPVTVAGEAISFDERVEENPEKFDSRYIAALIRFKRELPVLLEQFQSDNPFYIKMISELKYLFPV